MVAMEWDPNYVPPVKLGLHIAQIVLSFVIWCLEIAVFRSKDAKIVGTNGWTFGVCFLSVPAWIYLIMTPRWQRTRRFANPHAMLVVDGLFTVVWLSAFATQASYNSKDLCGEGCKLSKVIVGLGVFETLLWGGSTFISAYTMTYSNFHGVLPGYDSRKIRGGGGDNIDPDKAAFSTAPHDDDAYERVNMDDHEAQYGGSYNSRYGNPNPYDDDDDPNRYGALPPRNNDLFVNDTGYGGGSAVGSNISSNVHSNLSSNPYSDVSGYGEPEPAQFPSANYDRVQR